MAAVVAEEAEEEPAAADQVAAMAVEGLAEADQAAAKVTDRAAAAVKAAGPAAVDTREAGGISHGSGGRDFSPVKNPLSGTAFSLTGRILSLVDEARGQGLVLLAEGQVITVYGTGPDRFWRSLNLARPRPGETATVRGHTLDYNGFKVNLAIDLVLPGRRVRLRDPATGRAPWN